MSALYCDMDFSIEVFESFPCEAIFAKKQECYTPFIVKHMDLVNTASDILDMLAKSDKETEISCIDPDETEFRGESSKREKVMIKLSSFIDCFRCHEKHSLHWLDEAKLNLYLSQATLLSVNQNDCININSDLISDLIVPSYIQHLYQANVWININQAITNIHYDSNHNLLVVLQGNKDVSLSPPINFEEFQFYPASSQSSNHSIYSPHLTKAFKHSQSFQLTKGNAIFIPEGWFHGVTSSECTIAINYWFRSSLHSLLSMNKHLSPYIFRHVYLKLIEDSGNNISFDYQRCIEPNLRLNFEAEVLQFYKDYVSEAVYPCDYSKKKAKIECFEENTESEWKKSKILCEHRLFCYKFSDMIDLWTTFASSVRLLSEFS